MGNVTPDSRGSVLAPLFLEILRQDGQDPESAIMKALRDPQESVQQEDVQQAAIVQQVPQAQFTEQQGNQQLNNIPPEIAQMLGAPLVNPEQQAQQQQLQAQEERRQREAQNRASFEKNQEFENVVKVFGNVNGLMQNR